MAGNGLVAPPPRVLTLCVLLQAVSCAVEVTDGCTAGSGLTLFTWSSEGSETSSLLQTQHKLLSSLDWLFLTIIPALVHLWSLWMFLGRVIQGFGVLEEDNLFYSILFRCGIYKGSKIGSKRKAHILLNWRLPQNRQLQSSLSLFSQPVLSSMTWFEDHLQWDQKVIFPVLAPHATSLSHYLSAGWEVRQEWILASPNWTMNISRKGNNAVKVKLDLREPAKP